MDSKEYHRIADRYLDDIYRIVFSYCKNKETTEDAVQNAFIKLLKSTTICAAFARGHTHYVLAIQYFLEQLPPNYKAVIHLYYYERYPVKDIADILNISEANVQIRLKRARDKMRVLLEEE